MTSSISDNVRNCIKAFDNVESNVRQSQNEGDGEGKLPNITEELARFKVWCSNIGAHHKGRSSLEYRLRDASNMKNHVNDLLQDLNESLVDVLAILTGDKKPWDEDNISNFPYEDVDAEDFDFESEIDQIFADIIKVIDTLYRISTSLRNPTPHDRFMSLACTYYERTDINHVREKYPSAEDLIVQRLGKAISHRRQYFKYRGSHHDKLAMGLDFDSSKTELGIQSTIASSIPEALKGTGSIARGFESIDEDQRSDSGFTQTSITTSATGDSARLQIPPIPKQASKGPFECPFCFMMISLSRKGAWKRHVFADLLPYVCLYEDCSSPDREFDRRHHWIIHVQQEHWKTWSCPFGCVEVFSSPDVFRKHLEGLHMDTVELSQVPTLVTLSGRPRTEFQSEKYPLCEEIITSVKQYQHHVGHHQEDLALFALPSALEDHETEAGSDISEEEISELETGMKAEQKHKDGIPEAISKPETDASAKPRADKAGIKMQAAAAEEGKANEMEGKKTPELGELNPGNEDAPIRFKDAVGRKFSFPFHLCREWTGMEELIKQAFQYVDIIGPHVQVGHYDLIGPMGEIILPAVWDKVIEPGWEVSMHMWPMELRPQIVRKVDQVNVAQSNAPKKPSKKGGSMFRQLFRGNSSSE